MEKLKELLVIDSDATEKEVQNRFQQLAEKLFNEYEIEKGERHYDFLEIEFYFFNKFHNDIATYKRIMKAGKWHTHLSGVDISFESDEEHYGGILIRSIIDDKGEMTNGPLCTLNKLFDNIDIEGNIGNLPVIRKKSQFNDITPEATYRFHIKDGGYEKCKYRYFNNSVKCKSGYPANPQNQIHPLDEKQLVYLLKIYRSLRNRLFKH